MSGCTFCDSSLHEIITESENVIAIVDRYPITKGHALVLPKEHVVSLFDLAPKRIADVWRMVSEVRAILGRKFCPNGFTIGINDGEAAGQTVSHAHVHVIPRYYGDVVNPRGESVR